MKVYCGSQIKMIQGGRGDISNDVDSNVKSSNCIMFKRNLNSLKRPERPTEHF